MSATRISFVLSFLVSVSLSAATYLIVHQLTGSIHAAIVAACLASVAFLAACIVRGQLARRNRIAGLRRVVATLRCPTHDDGGGTVTVRRNGRRLRFIVNGCCDQFVELVQAEIERTYEPKWMTPDEPAALGPD